MEKITLSCLKLLAIENYFAIKMFFFTVFLKNLHWGNFVAMFKITGNRELICHKMFLTSVLINFHWGNYVFMFKIIGNRGLFCHKMFFTVILVNLHWINYVAMFKLLAIGDYCLKNKGKIMEVICRNACEQWGCKWQHKCTH